MEFVEESYGADSSEEAIPILHSLSMVSCNWKYLRLHTFNLFQVARLNEEYSKSIELLRRANTITLDHYGSRSVNTASSNQLLAGAYLLLWQNDNTKSLLEEAKKIIRRILTSVPGRMRCQ